MLSLLRLNAVEDTPTVCRKYAADYHTEARSFPKVEYLTMDMLFDLQLYWGNGRSRVPSGWVPLKPTFSISLVFVDYQSHTNHAW